MFLSFKSKRQHTMIPEPMSQNLPNEGVPKYSHHNISFIQNIKCFVKGNL